MITNSKEKDKPVMGWKRKLLFPLILQIVSVIIFIGFILLFAVVLFLY